MKLHGISLYIAVVLPYLIIPIALLPFGVEPTIGLSISLLLVIASAIVATIYVVGLYRRTGEPRSVFFGMLVSALEVKVAFGAWIGYLISANLLASVIALPIPPPAVRAIVNAIAAIVLLVSAVYYALTIRIERRRAEDEDLA